MPSFWAMFAGAFTGTVVYHAAARICRAWLTWKRGEDGNE